MKKLQLFTVILLAFSLFSSRSFAEMLLPVVFTPFDFVYEAASNSDPLRPAHTFPEGVADGHDIWTFDFSAFDPLYFLDTTLTLGDDCCEPDNHQVYWDGISLGETGLGIPGEWSFETTPDVHTLEVEWLNPIPGGALYNISLYVQTGSAIPAQLDEPFVASIFGFSMMGLGIARRKRKRPNDCNV